MRIFLHTGNLPEEARGAVLALGNFDGVHRGHQAVIRRAGAEAAALGGRHGVLTFEPHPRRVFRPDDPPFRLTPFRPKMEAIAALGCDLAFSLHFDRRFAQQTAEDFVAELLHRQVAAVHVVAGYDFVFGRDRQGDAALLERLGHSLGFAVTIVPPAGEGGGAFSSTQIRDYLTQGSPRAAAALLGRAWEIDGRVRRGDARGRTIGFPTANLWLGEYLRPAAGVYAVRAGIRNVGGEVEWHDAVANIGTRPTVGGTDLRLEVHIFDFAGDLYGRPIRVRLLDWIRPEQRFAGLAELTGQIARDSARARVILAALPPDGAPDEPRTTC